MLIVDSQVHIWAPNTPENPWPAGRHNPHRQTPFSRDDLLEEMESASVDRAVIIPPGWAGESNALGLEAARLHPDKFAVMGRFNPELPGALAKLKTWRQPGMLGIRMTFAGLKEYAAPLLEHRLGKFWEAAEKFGVPLMMSCPPQLLHFVDEVLHDHPRLRIAIDHLGRHLHEKDEAAYRDLDKLLALADRPNLAVKASGLPSHTDDPYPYRRLHPYLHRVYDAFGPRRIFWGTDLTKLPCTYRQSVTAFTDEIPWLSQGDRELIMGKALCDWLGWPY